MKYLKVLLELGILKKETPIAEKTGRKTVYVIDDTFFRFWYRFVPRISYQNEKIGTEELELLRRNAAVFRGDAGFRYYIFSKSGFTSALMEAEKRGEVTLLTLEDLYKSNTPLQAKGS